MKLINKFPSFETLMRGAASAFKRFPFALLSAVVATISLIIIIGTTGDADIYWLQKLAMASGLGLPFFIALVTWAEKREFGREAIIFIQAIGAILVMLYYLSLPHDPFVNYTYIIRFLLLLVTFHFLVAFLPYLGGNQVEGFWQYNKSLFLRFLNSALFSAVMYIGLALALLAADELFGFDIHEKRYFQLFIIVAITFNSWLFLSGIPQNLRELNEITFYPNGLRIFAQYILLPLIGLYFLILYAYEFKIIFTWNWPKGWVSQLVLWFSVVGILSLLLLWPLRNLTENRWIKTFTKWFFRALVPLVVMLFLAVLERIGEYGITVNRFLVLAMSVGLTILVLYFIFGRAKDIRIIPIVVCLIALLSAYGPWSAFAISKYNQRGKLEKRLEKSGLLVDGRLKPASNMIPYKDRQEMSEIITYLGDWHGFESFSPWLSDSTINSLKAINKDHFYADTVASALGFEYVNRGHIIRGGGEYFNINKADSPGLAISGYDYFYYYNGGGKDTFYIENDTFYIWKDTLSTAINILICPDSIEGEFSFTADSIRKAVENTHHDRIDGDRFNYEIPLGNYFNRLDIRHLSGWVYPESVNINSVDAYILLRKAK